MESQVECLREWAGCWTAEPTWIRQARVTFFLKGQLTMFSVVQSVFVRFGSGIASAGSPRQRATRSQNLGTLGGLTSYPIASTIAGRLWALPPIPARRASVSSTMATMTKNRPVLHGLSK